MEVFYDCIKAVLDECHKTGLTLNKNLCKIENSTDVNFDLPINRIAFLYKFGTYNIHFFKKCFLNFVSESIESPAVLEQILSSKLVCSLSIGPGTDIIGLQLGLKELGKAFNQNTFFKILSKYGSWRNTMNFLTGVKASVIPVIGNFKLMQCNVMGSLSSKAENCLKSADIVLMDHAFASPNAQRVKILDTLKVLLQILKPGAYIFFIDTKKKLSYFELLNSYGNYIYGPVGVQVDGVPYNDIVAKEIGADPVHSGQAYFGVWQKSINMENTMINNVSLVNVIPAKGNFEEVSSCDKNVKQSVQNATIASISMKNQLGNTSVDHAPPANLTPVIQNFRGASISYESNSSQLFQSSTENLSTSAILIKSRNGLQGNNINCSLTATNNTNQKVLSSDELKELNRENVEIGDHRSECTEDMKILLQSLNSLVSKLENFVSSEIASRNSCSFLKCSKHVPACSSSCDNQCFHYHKCCSQNCKFFREHICCKHILPNVNLCCSCHATAHRC